MSTTNRDGNPTSAQGADLDKLEMFVQRGLDTFVAATNALSALHEVWLAPPPRTPPADASSAGGARERESRPAPRVWGETLRDLAHIDLSAVEIRVVIGGGAPPAAAAAAAPDAPAAHPPRPHRGRTTDRPARLPATFWP